MIIQSTFRYAWEVVGQVWVLVIFLWNQMMNIHHSHLVLGHNLDFQMIVHVLESLCNVGNRIRRMFSFPCNKNTFQSCIDFSYNCIYLVLQYFSQHFFQHYDGLGHDLQL